MANWGPRADSLQCNAEMRVYDPLSDFCVYIYAQNRDDCDEIYCLINGFDVQTTLWSMQELDGCYNSAGEKLKIDHTFRPTHVGELYKKLTKGKTKWTKQT